MEKAKIQIVEDEAIIAMEIESSLQNLGYQVTSIVDTGEKAIKKAETDKPDLIVMDIRIKGEKDGIEVAEIIRTRFDIPVIFLTAYLDEERIDRAKIVMPFGYILKPIQERDLKISIEMALYVCKIEIERKKAKDALKKEKEKFQLLYEKAPLSYQSLDENGCFIDVNNEWLKSLGYSKDEVIGKSFSDFLHPDWAAHFKENFPRFKSLGEINGIEFNIKKKDGSLILVSFNGKIGYDSDGSFKQTHCIWKNITSEKTIEDKLRESEVKYRKLFDDSIDGYVICVAETGIILDCNTALQNMVERSKEALIGQHQNILHPSADADQVYASIYKKHLSQKLGELFQAQIVTKSGEIKNISILARIFDLGNEAVIHGIFRMMDQ